MRIIATDSRNKYHSSRLISARNGRQRITRRRAGAAAMELAILALPLSFFLVVAIDYSRIFYYATTIESSAYQGALYGSASSTKSTDTTGIQTAAHNETSDLSTQPNVSSSTGTDSNSNTTVSVTVTYTFQTVVNYPGIPSSVTLSRTVTMRVLQ